jgi:hypothetical protein
VLIRRVKLPTGSDADDPTDHPCYALFSISHQIYSRLIISSQQGNSVKKFINGFPQPSHRGTTLKHLRGASNILVPGSSTLQHLLSRSRLEVHSSGFMAFISVSRNVCLQELLIDCTAGCGKTVLRWAAPKWYHRAATCNC